jgi:hypothetical protein
MKDEAMSTLTEFLLARIAEDELSAFGNRADGYTLAVVDGVTGTTVGGARLRAECEAKRRIVEKCDAAVRAEDWDDNNVPTFADETLRLLAAPYAP